MTSADSATSDSAGLEATEASGENAEPPEAGPTDPEGASTADAKSAQAPPLSSVNVAPVLNAGGALPLSPPLGVKQRASGEVASASSMRTPPSAEAHIARKITHVASAVAVAVNTAPTRGLSLGTGSVASSTQEKFRTAMRRSKSVPAHVREHRQHVSDKGHAATPTLRKSRASHTSGTALPKSTAAAVAGAGSVAAKARKKGLPKKMVLPFSYGFDDPRVWHVESTEGRICPEYLPP